MRWTRRAPGDYVSMNLEYAVERGPIGWELHHGTALILIADRKSDAQWYAQAHQDGRREQIMSAIDMGEVRTQADLNAWKAARS